MAFKERTSLDADVTTAIGGQNKKTGKKNPSTVEGYYLGSRQVESKKSKGGLASLHFLQTSKGNIGVWGKTDLDRKLSGVEAGCMVRITHTGMQATPNGEMYKYKVEVDDENTIEVSAQEDVSSGSEDTESEDTYGEDESAAGGFAEEEEAPEEEEDNSALLAANAKAAAERKAKVQNLLKGKGKKA